MATTPPWEVKRELIYRAEEETSPDYGCEPQNRPIESYITYGIINLDKPPGPTSHEVAATVRKIVGVDRVGHGGTLGAAAGDIPS